MTLGSQFIFICGVYENLYSRLTSLYSAEGCETVWSALHNFTMTYIVYGDSPQIMAADYEDGRRYQLHDKA